MGFVADAEEECLLRKLREELARPRKTDLLQKALKMKKYKIQELERDDMKLVQEKAEMEKAKKEEEVNLFRARAQLRREKIENMRAQNLVDQIRSAEDEGQIRHITKNQEEVKLKKEQQQQHIKERLKTIRNKLLNAPWVTSRCQEEEELAGIRKQVNGKCAQVEQLLQSIQAKETILAESSEPLFQKFCLAVVPIALKNCDLLKVLAKVRVSFVQRKQELSDHGLLDASMMSQQVLSDASQVLHSNHSQPVEEKSRKPSAYLSSGCDAESSEINSDENMLVKKVENECGIDHREKDSIPGIVMSNADNCSLEKNIKLIVINEEEEKMDSDVVMDTDENNTVQQTEEELVSDTGRSDEITDNLNEKRPMLDSLSVDFDQTSERVSEIDKDFASNFVANCEEVENTVVEGGEGAPVPENDEQPSGDPDPTSFFTSFTTNFAPNIATVNLSNTNFGIDGDFDASAIFNLSTMVQNHSGTGSGNDYMALFDGVDITADEVRRSDSEGFALDFGNSSAGNEAKKDADNEHFFIF